MSNHKLSLQGFFHKLGSFYRKITKSFVNGVLRYVLFYQRRGKLSTAGFILPTTVLLILVVVLTVGALTFRAYNRNIQVIGDAQQRVIYNAATPAIDRARSKLEFLFDSTKDTRLPSGVPSQGTLQAMMLNDGSASLAQLRITDTDGVSREAYTFPDETRIDINGGGNDNAWYFRTDTDGNGVINEKDSTVVYSIALNTPPATSTQTIQAALLQKGNVEKAKNLWVRQAPLSVDGALGCATNTSGNNAGPDGWFNDKISTAKLRKNFQVDALVIPGNSGGTKATLEFTQDRQLDRGNKWGAWFRHDLEIYPGPQFNWNGAMHTEGSLIIGGDKFSAYLISAPNSCLYNPPSNSDITVANQTGGTPTTDLLGVVASGLVKDGTTGGSSTIYLHSSNPANANATLKQDTANLKSSVSPFDITIDPTTVVLQNGYTNISPTTVFPGASFTKSNATDRNNRGSNLNSAKKDLPDFKNQDGSQRISANSEAAPYVDDLYRADNRWGPKPKYKAIAVPDGKFGQPILRADLSTDSDYQQIVNNTVVTDDTDASNVGLDGYWERRARVKGLRILVGQRLELGNLFTWYAPQDKDNNGFVGNNNAQIDQGDAATGYEYEGDPLYPPTVKPYPATSTTPATILNGGLLSQVDQQRRTLRDNLSAVQSTAVYHASADPTQPDYPVACLATTSHPGTLWTIRQALTFRPFNFGGMNADQSLTQSSLLTNFFTGSGTNGWEFEPPAKDFNSYTTQIVDPNSPLRIALRNLANFAGDHQTINGTLKSGAFPPTPNDPDKFIHPYPALSMWGDYSNLKRALQTLNDNGNNLSSLSIADQTYLQTAACTVGMLAYSVDQIQKFDPSAIDSSSGNAPNDKPLTSANNTNVRLLAQLGRDLWQLMNGTNSGAGSDDPEVLSKAQLQTYGYLSSTASPTVTNYKASDYQNVPPEAFIAALRQYLLSRPTKPMKPDDLAFNDEMRLAEMIMLNHQIRRDRTFGFKPSPIFGQYSFKPSFINDVPVSLPAACDPDQFAFTAGDTSNPQTSADTILSNNMGPIKTALLPQASTMWVNGSLAVNSPSNLPTPLTTNTAGINLSLYRLALSRLCGTTMPDPTAPTDPTKATVLPKFPALYYLFPEVPHDYNGDSTSGDYNHQQPQAEPYTSPYVAGDPNQNNYVGLINAQFQPVSTTPAPGRAGYASVVFPPNNNPPSSTSLSRQPGYTTVSTSVFPVKDLSVSSLAIQPNLGKWNLPKDTTPNPTSNAANFSPNLILDGTANPNSAPVAVAVPFLDRAFFDARQLMMVRTLDLDLGMLRSTPVGTSDVWLPVSGIVYAFREDAVREDMISRPVCTGANCTMNLQDPARPVDPSVLPVPPQPPGTARTTLNPGENGISLKAIDSYPDPDRRVRGFRLRNGVQVMRNRSFTPPAGSRFSVADNNKGLSFFTDQPTYIQGDFNLHQDGNDDTIGPNALEEFNQLLPSGYDANKFYGRTTLNPNFATVSSDLSSDRWRPSEILADSVTVLSNGFCDGSIADTFLQYNNSSSSGVDPGFKGTSAYPVPDADVLNVGSPSSNRSYYNSINGLFDPGCANSNLTSFHNQNRPAQSLSTKTAGTQSGWAWVRENSRYDAVAERRVDSGSNTNPTGHWVDITAPVKISRSGQPLVVRPRTTVVEEASAKGQVLPPIPYNVAFPTQPYYSYGVNVNNGFSANNPQTRITAVPTQINTIMVSGISPSRPKQGYGGLHNFPRFLEDWKNTTELRFSGSFIQLSYTNYATSPFDLENLEPWNNVPTLTDPNNENILYYVPPQRRWGYDVALQFSSAGPAAARFVNLSKNRSEYYVEPPANDPYITNLCKAVTAISTLNLSNVSCPTGGS